MFKKNYELYELFVVINGEFMVIRVKKMNYKFHEFVSNVLPVCYSTFLN